MSNTVQMSAAEIAAKFNNKAEFHFFLTHELNAFLPTSDRVTIYHLRDLMSGDKKVSTLFDVFNSIVYFNILFLGVGLLWRIILRLRGAVNPLFL